jgi:hypothetical protein
MVIYIYIYIYTYIPYYHYLLSAGLDLSSTILYLDNCLYAKNTMKAIMRKSIILEIKSPYLNSVVVPARFVTLKESASRLPAGRKNQ